MAGLLQYVKASRVEFTCDKEFVRMVHVSDLIKEVDEKKLSDYIADKAPLLYRKINKLVESLQDGFFLTAVKETLAKLPTADSFQSSHFGEIASCLFAEEVIGLKKIYSKLSLNSAENQNGLKMDILFYKPGTVPMQFYFGEVKSSDKDHVDGLPPKHDASCYPSLFNSLREYTQTDLDFDLTTIKDNLENLPLDDQNQIRKALVPYGARIVNYIGFIVIDITTKDDTEIPVLGTRKSEKEFNVDLICIEGYKEVSRAVYEKIQQIKKAL